jgi:recombination protein RecA
MRLVRLDIRRVGSIKDKEEVTGSQTRVKVVKNKVSPPFKVMDFDIMYGSGISKLGEIIDIGVKLDIVEKSGAWFSYNNVRIGQGRENSKQYLLENPKIADEIEQKIRQQSSKLDSTVFIEEAAEETEIGEEA